MQIMNSKNKILSSIRELDRWFETTISHIQTYDPVSFNPMNLSDLAQAYFSTGAITNDDHFTQKGLANLKRLIAVQNADGSWNETDPKINCKSTLATAYVGCNLLKSVNFVNGKLAINVENSVMRASQYVRSNELAPGYFLKSDANCNDTVNVNTICSFFFLYLSKHTNLQGFFQISLRTIKRALKSQMKTGVFPYYAAKKPHLAPISYHAIMMRLLAEYHCMYGDDLVLDSLKKAVDWFTDRLDEQFMIHWKGDLGAWAYRTFSTYGYALCGLVYLSKFENQFQLWSQRILNHVVRSQLQDGSFPVVDNLRNLANIGIDVTNGFCLASHGDFRATLSLARRSFGKTSFHEKITGNIQLFEALSSLQKVF